MRDEDFVYAYAVGHGFCGALDYAGWGSIASDQPEELARRIRARWPGLPVYCGHHRTLAVQLRQWLPDVRDGVPGASRTP